jgi:amidohydrolase
LKAKEIRMELEGLLESAAALRPWLVEIRRELHMRPELGLEEYGTAAAIEARLDEIGVAHERRGTAVVGLLRGGHSGPCVALRADIDALPIRETRDVAYRSKVEGRMHACGHDAHMAIQLGAARLLAGMKDKLGGSVKLLFQPAEETVGGADTLVKGGCLEDPHVDRVYGLHVMPYIPVGCIEVRKGALNGCSATLSIEVRGKAAHGAYPETGIDAILIAANVVTALNVLVCRYVSPLEEAVITVGTIQGGTASNILADRVGMEATLRATNGPSRDALIARAKTVVEGIAASYGGSAAFAATLGYEALINHDEAVDAIVETAAGLLGPGSVRWKAKPSMGVEDFAYYIKERSGAFWHLGCGNEAKGVTAPLHSAEFDMDEDCLPIGAAMQAGLALRFLGEGKKG